jgi:hypothetical protein
MRGALRSALGGINEETGEWELQKPDPSRLRQTRLPHDRGGILLAAVFSAFLAIYKSRSADLFRIASNGSGVMGAGEIHPDLVRRLAREAANAAEAVLTMCIRGLDYCPPVDVDFGTYLRAVVTGDMEAFPQEKYNYRVAFIEAFRQWGIYPEGVRSMAENDLRYPRLDEDTGSLEAARRKEPERRYDQQATQDIFEGLKISDARRRKEGEQKLRLDWDLTANREEVWKTMEHNAKILHGWLTQDSMRGHLSAFGLILDPNAPPSVYRSRDGRTPSLEVHSVRVARRQGYRGTLVTDLVVEVRQRRRGYFDADLQKAIDEGKTPLQPADFRFRRGCTLIIDPVNRQVRYAISTRGNVADNEELDRVRRFLKGEEGEVENPFYGVAPSMDLDGEHFAAVHRRTAAVPDF